MYCRNCGANTGERANFCSGCGSKLDGPQHGQLEKPPKVYTVRTALQEYFQGALSETKLREWVRRGKIPHARVGRRILFRREALDKWFAEQEKAATQRQKHKRLQVVKG